MCLKKLKLLERFSAFHFLMMLLAGVINAIGVTLFIAPVQDVYKRQSSS